MNNTTKIICGIIAIVIIFGIGFLFFGNSTDRISSSKLIPVIQTKDIDANSEFQFTISPNGKWLIYLKTEPEELVILNLIDFKKSKLDLTDIEYTWFSLNANECWTQDSKYCVYPSLALNHKSISHPQLIIDINDGNKPKLVRQESYKSTENYISYVDLQPDLLFSCSDCVSSAIKKNEKSLMQMQPYVESHLYFSTGNEVNHDSSNIISHDKNKIYFQQGRRTKETILYEFDIPTQKNKKLHSFSATLRDCATIDRLRLSPNQKHLAMQVSYGCTWITPPELYIANLDTGELVSVAKNVYYDMHWGSHSQRLYFYKCDVGGGCGEENDHIYFFDIN